MTLHCISGRNSLLNHNSQFINSQNLLPKRRQRQPRHLKMLPSKRYANDGDAKENPKKQVGEGNPDAADKNPDDIHQDAEATARAIRRPNLATERPEGEDGKFQRLDAERYADDGNHKDKAGNQIFHRRDEATEEEPDDVAEKIHVISILNCPIPLKSAV